ncbi:MAG: hypothetical protein R2762_29745 [Bryobacteraceae bacterium]
MVFLSQRLRRIRLTQMVLAASALCPAVFAQSAEPPTAPDPATDSQPEAPAPAATTGQASSNQRTQLNLLGEVNAKTGEGQRNENVRLTLIDNNVLKELNTRMGTTANLVESFDVERNYFGAEFGGSGSALVHIAKPQASPLHGELFWSHSNSALSARSFFQAGNVQPARTNDYGFSITAPVGERTFLTGSASRRRLRGQVNGNVLVPAADERVPLTTDPAARALVQALLGAYGRQIPNRTDINPRALNTNAPQNIDNDRAESTLDRRASEKDHLVARYGFTLQDVEAFQLVGGQNPDTTTRSHQARLTWIREWSPGTTTDLSVGFDRIGSLLVAEETSLGPRFVFSRLLESVGPDDNIPINRAQNLFRYAGRLNRNRGSHSWRAGFSILRRQVNGSEANNHRGTFSFRRDFGRSVTENLLLGTPSEYRVALGDPHRGFRNWDLQLFAGDHWQVRPNLTIDYGIRYEPVTRPNEVNGLSTVPYDCDCNNLAPRFGFAYRANDRWGVFRGAYGIQYGEIFAATFMQSRFNAPGVVLISVQQPDLGNPLKGVSAAELSGTGRSTLFRLDPELSSPYSQQYNFSWQIRPAPQWALELGYVGSRSWKLLQQWYMNRARPVPGIPLITATINERRSDPAYFDILHTVNGSRGYYDAAKAELRVPRWRGLSLMASYWFSKAIDLGASYTNTGSGRDGRGGRSPAEFNVHGQMKGPSDFDQSHAALWNADYQTPMFAAGPDWLEKALGSWQFASVVLIKTGTPFAIRTADSPGSGNVDGAGSDRPSLVDPSVLGVSVDHPDTAAQKLPREAFRSLSAGELTGNLGNNVFRKDGLFNVNAAVSRRFPLGGGRSLLFRAESLNLTNHPQFAEPGIDMSGDNFGRITNTLNDGRAFRFQMRLVL